MVNCANVTIFTVEARLQQNENKAGATKKHKLEKTQICTPECLVLKILFQQNVGHLLLI